MPDGLGEAISGFVVGVIFTAVGAVYVTGSIVENCHTNYQKTWQKACVEHNAAHWETASDGSTTFVWNEEVSE